MKLGDPAGRIHPNQARYQLRYTRIPVHFTRLPQQMQAKVDKGSATGRPFAVCFLMSGGPLLSLFQHAQQTPLEDLPSGGDQLRFNLGRTALRLTLGLGFRLFLLALGLAARLVLQLLLAAACFIVQLLLALKDQLVFLRGNTLRDVWVETTAPCRTWK